jgi:hypothetical protein
MSVPSPLIDTRSRDEVLRDLLEKLPGYLPGWEPGPGSPGMALGEIFARYTEIFMEGLNRTPDRHFLAFLDALGCDLLPAQSARAALVFSLMDTSPVDTPLPKDSLVAAPPQPDPPSPLLEAEESEQATEPVLFATTQTVTLTRARLAALYSLNPQTDEYADHLEQASSGFSLFGDLRPVEHALYLGHDELFALAGEAEIRFSIATGPRDPSAPPPELEIEWEYLSQDGWLPLEIEDDRTANLTAGGQIVLRKSCGPDSMEQEIAGQTSYWLRGRLASPLPPQGSPIAGQLPSIDSLKARVGFVKSGLQPESAFTDAFSLDTANNFYPFGRQPVRYTTFYIASEEVLQRRGARVALHFELSEDGDPSSNLELAWEYYDGATWQRLDTGFDFQDGTEAFTRSGSVTFLCPPDLEETSVNGEDNYWLRVRINRGDYGLPMRLRTVDDGGTTKVEVDDSTLAPPVVSSLTLQYTYQTQLFLLDHCLTYNDFVYEGRTQESRWPRRPFEPFRPVSDRQPAVYFGFDRRLPSGLVSAYVHVPPEAGEAAGAASDLVWEYRSERGWSELGVLDQTRGFRRSGMIQWIGPRDAAAEPGLNGELYRIRARLIQGQDPGIRSIGGAWLNAVWGTERAVFEREVLGSAAGRPGETFSIVRRSGAILESERIELREWSGRGEGWQTAALGIPESDLRFERDPATGEILAVWVLWHSQTDLFNSGPDDRHYILERSTGLVRFGDGLHGMVPPAGARLAASYSSGGGLRGNLPAGAISELRTGVPFLMGVTNPVPSEGGAATEGLEAVRRRGPQLLRHRDRVLSAADYEWLALEASPAVARARCLPLVGADGKAQRGWVSLVIVPHSQEARPLPTAEIKSRVREHLARRLPAAIAANLRILNPEYRPISVSAELVARHPEQAARVEALLRQNLDTFLHPLTGGPDGAGWNFGQPVYLSQIARVIEETEGLDYASQVVLRVGEQVYRESVPVGQLGLASAGDHELQFKTG